MANGAKLAHRDREFDVGTSFGGARNSISSAFDANSQTDPGWSISYDPSNYAAALSFKASLDALVQSKKAKVLAHPTILATDNTGSQINIVDKDSQGNQFSLLSRRELVAQQVEVASGSLLALGGLTQTVNTTVDKKFPILGELPIIGYLFSSTSSQERKTELLITMTPHVLAD